MKMYAVYNDQVYCAWFYTRHEADEWATDRGYSVEPMNITISPEVAPKDEGGT